MGLLFWSLALGQNLPATKVADGISLSNKEISTFISNEYLALDGLRNGTVRLERLCASAPRPSNEKSGPLTFSEFPEPMRENAQRLWASAQRSVSLTQQALAGAQQNSAEACSPLNRFKSLWSKSATEAQICERAKQKEEALRYINKAANEWFSIHEERQRLFSKLMKMETAGCTRNGFTQRMVQAHESSLAAFEVQALEMFETALRKETATQASKP